MGDLLSDVETFMSANKMSPTRLGREALKDPNFVFELRKGREMLPRNERRLRDWMLAYQR